MPSELDEKPVIIGSSLTGLLISLSLSKAGIDHVLIGSDEPLDEPRLGESLNECAGPELWQHYGFRHREFFTTKSHISLLNGCFASMIHISEPNRSLKRMSTLNGRNNKQCHGSIWGDALLHVDRSALDRVVYRDALASQHCRFISTPVQEVAYHAPSDTVQHVALEDTMEIAHPHYVFDATGPRGLVASAAQIPIQSISNEQRVVWGHYRRSERSSLPKLWWLYGTNLLRLQRDIDGVDGISWLIPLDHAVSVGISVDRPDYPESEYGQEALLQRMTEAYQRRGIDYCSIYPQLRPVQDLHHRYYIRDRAFGKNWLLAGGTFLSVWFPSSSGLWTTTAAASLAPQLLEEPERIGLYYQTSMRGLIDFHKQLERMIHGTPFESHMDVYRFWSCWLAGVPGRLSEYLRIEKRHIGTKRPMYWFLESARRLFISSPPLQLLLWGLFVIRSQRDEQLSKQADSFSGYFQTYRFRLCNFLRGGILSIASLFRLI